MEKCRCRTCFQITDTKECIDISETCYLENSVKDVIVMLVPYMEATLLDHESICRDCFTTLKSTTKFIKRCLEVELINAKERTPLEENDDLPNYAWQDSEIEESKEVLDNLNTFLDLDHSYVKKEPVALSENQNDFSQSFSASVEELSECQQNDDCSDSPTEYLFYESLSLYTDNEEDYKNNATLESSSLQLETTTNGEDVDCLKSEAEQDTFSCSNCSEKFSCEDDYKLHLEFHPEVVCELCGEGCKTKHSCENHMRKDYFENPVQTKSPERKRFQGASTRAAKRRVNMSGIILLDPGEPVMCKLCGKMYPALLNLKAHLQTHVKVKRHKCQYCSLTFSVKGNCMRHEKLHEADPEHKFRCNICWKKTKTEEELEQHVVVHYNRPPNYACEICGEKFHRRYLLDNHRLDVHTDPEDIEKLENEIVLKNLLEYADPSCLY